MTTLVVPKIGHYVVRTLDEHGPHTEQVDKAKQCSCGGNGAQPCAHIRAVAAYLQLGGPVAPKPEEPSPVPELPEVCPICARPVVASMNHWRCTASAGHYWRWRGEQSGVKAFLTQPHPAKQGAFYEQSNEERETFLQHAHQRLYANGYSPYG